MPQKTIFLVVLVMALVSNTSAQDTVRGTVVVVALTEHGVVLGSDHLRQITSMSDPAENELKRLDVPKFLQCGPDIVCSSAGLAEMEIECSFESPLGVRKGGHLKYSSYNWIPQIQDDGTNTGQASPKRLAELIWEKARSTFDPIECFMRTKEGQFLVEGGGPVLFLVAGYAKGSEVPELYAVRVQIDRENARLRYPPPEQLFPKSAEGWVPEIFFAGYKRHIMAALSLQEPEASRFKHYLLRRLPQVRSLMSDSPSSLQEVVATVASYIDVESKFNEKVGGGSSIMVLRRGTPPRIINMPEWEPEKWAE